MPGNGPRKQEWDGPITRRMRIFTGIVSAIFVALGIWMAVTGALLGLAIAGFFALCLLVAVFEKRLRVPVPPSEFRLPAIGRCYAAALYASWESE